MRRADTSAFRRLPLFAALALMPAAAFLLLAHEGHSHAPASAKSLKNPLTATPENLTAGRSLYVRNCATCHGANGKSQTPAASGMKVKPADLTGHDVHSLTEGEIFWVITNGIQTSGMPGSAARTSDRERWQITLYVRQLSQPADKH